MILIVKNKKINFNYNIVTKFTAGAILYGAEAKSIRSKQVSITNCFVTIENNNIILNNCIINFLFFITTNIPNNRKIKLLLKKKEIILLKNFLKKNGFTIVVEQIYLSNGWIKFLICVVIGKKKKDKREYLKKKDFLIHLNKLN